MASTACVPPVPAPRAAVGFRERARGALPGLAVGDALGAPSENMKPSEIRARWGRITGYVADRPAGTDDTEYAIFSWLLPARYGAALTPVHVETAWHEWIADREEGPFRGAGFSERGTPENLRRGLAAPVSAQHRHAWSDGLAMRAAPYGAFAARRPAEAARLVATDGSVSHEVEGMTPRRQPRCPTPRTPRQHPQPTLQPQDNPPPQPARAHPTPHPTSRRRPRCPAPPTGQRTTRGATRHRPATPRPHPAGGRGCPGWRRRCGREQVSSRRRDNGHHGVRRSARRAGGGHAPRERAPAGARAGCGGAVRHGAVPRPARGTPPRSRRGGRRRLARRPAPGRPDARVDAPAHPRAGHLRRAERDPRPSRPDRPEPAPGAVAAGPPGRCRAGGVRGGGGAAGRGRRRARGPEPEPPDAGRDRPDLEHRRRRGRRGGRPGPRGRVGGTAAARPRLGAGRARQLRLSATPGAIRWAGRPHGADTEEVLAGPGLTPADVNELREEGVV